MVNIKITAIKTFSPEDVFGHEMKYPNDKVVTPCDHKGTVEGKEWIVENLAMPKDFCGWAWNDLYKDICILSFGGDHFWSEPDVTYTACSDGMRPVCFKLERLK